MNENDFRIVVGVQLSLCIVEFYRVKILGFSREGGGAGQNFTEKVNFPAQTSDMNVYKN